MDNVFSLSVITFVVLAIAFLGIGLFGIVRRKPFAFSARWMYGLLVLCYAPGFFLMGRPFVDFSLDGFGTMYIFIMAMNIVLLVYLWRQMSGYIVFGVSGDNLRQQLLDALSKLDLPYEEQLSKLYLPTVESELQVAVQDWVGIAQLRLKRSKDRALLPRIIRQLNAGFSKNGAGFRIITPLFYIVFGGLFLAFTAVFATSLFR